MKILFLSYWGATEGLSSATVIPHLRILAKFESVTEIIFCSIERNDNLKEPLTLGSKIKHIPLISDPKGSVLTTKANDFYIFPKQLKAICRQYKIDLIFCRSSLAGALGYLVHQKLKIPYVVESYEPHADYMVDAGVWKIYDPRLWIQRFFERRIKKTANLLLPVSDHYRKKLISEGVDPGKIILLPCCVSIPDFSFNLSKRNAIRESLNISQKAIAGIYVGKFGGMYYDEEAFELYRKSFQAFGEDFYLFILTADNAEEVSERVKKYNLPANKVIIRNSPHHQVPDYLSAADFAYSTSKPAPSRLYCSLIKNGEYWSNGLPILIGPHIGDDSEIIENEGGGVIMPNINDPDTALQKVKDLLQSGRVLLSPGIQTIAVKHRRLELVEDVYSRILGK